MSSFKTSRFQYFSLSSLIWLRLIGSVHFSKILMTHCDSAVTFDCAVATQKHAYTLHTTPTNSMWDLNKFWKLFPLLSHDDDCVFTDLRHYFWVNAFKWLRYSSIETVLLKLIFNPTLYNGLCARRGAPNIRSVWNELRVDKNTTRNFSSISTRTQANSSVDTLNTFPNWIWFELHTDKYKYKRLIWLKWLWLWLCVVRQHYTDKNQFIQFINCPWEWCGLNTCSHTWVYAVNTHWRRHQWRLMPWHW